MEVDKNLFLYDVAVAAIMKNEGHYIKEWLDYHLLAGVDHFYIYDNDSSDNQEEILQPYINKGFVTYKIFPGENNQKAAYHDAVRNFKLQCRYMAFIDGDEFIYTKNGKSISEVTDEILLNKKSAGGLCIHWHCFGSNNLEKADYSRGVLERFTRRAPDNYEHNSGCKAVTNPRKIKIVTDPHCPSYFEGYHAINEKGDLSNGHNYPASTEKILINHYCVKSKEEYVTRKIPNGMSDHFIAGVKFRQMDYWESHDRNDVFDDEILKYRDNRLDVLNRKGGGGKPS